MIHLRILKEIYKPLKKCDVFLPTLARKRNNIQIAYKRTKKAFAITCEGLEFTGAGEEIRTLDPRLGKSHEVTENKSLRSRVNAMFS